MAYAVGVIGHGALVVMVCVTVCLSLHGLGMLQNAWFTVSSTERQMSGHLE